MLVCTGSTSTKMMTEWLGDEGVRRPYMVVTMDGLWFEVAAELGRPRAYFQRKLGLMGFVNGHDIICIEANDGTEERMSMGASMYAMGAKSIPIASDEEV